MKSLSFRLTTTALAFLMLCWHQQSVVGFASKDNLSSPSSVIHLTYRTSKLLQSSRVLPSEETPSTSMTKVIHNLQSRFVEYQHVRKQHKLQRLRQAEVEADNMIVEGFVPVLKQYLHKPNKMLFQSHILAHQQAQYDHLHVHHEQTLKKSDTNTNWKPGSILQRIAQARKDAKDARLAAKYAAIESLEDRAFQICKDLGMI